MLAAPPKPRVVPAKLQSIDIGESIDVRLGKFAAASELRDRLKELRLAGLPRLTLVVVLSAEIEERDLLGMLDQATSLAKCVVLTGEVASLPVREAAGNAWACPVLVEPDVRHAIVGSLQWQAAGASLVVLGDDCDQAIANIGLGARWRGSWEAAEGGEFHAI